MARMFSKSIIEYTDMKTERDQLKARVAELGRGSFHSAYMEVQKERDRLAAELAEAVRLRDFHYGQAEACLRGETRAEQERDEARAELAALKGLLKEACEDHMRDDHDNEGWNINVRDFRSRCRAAGVEVAE